MIRCLITALIFLSALQVNAFEDYLITTKGRLTDISIEDNTIVDVYPVITLMNDKNTLMVSPLAIGKTRVCVLKNNKEKVIFNIEVYEDETIIDDVKGFDILSLDEPFPKFVLDKPPMLKEVK